MLEQNTDRSYFMIGAVIVAAILIAGATYIFRDVLFFGSNAVVPSLINGVFGKAKDMVGAMNTKAGT